MLSGNNKGSFTLEATIVFSAVIFIVIGVIYFCLMLYEQAYLQSFVQRIAAVSSHNWTYTNKDMLYGFVDREHLEDDSLYFRIWDSNENIKIENIKKFSRYDFGKYSLLSSKKDFSIDVKINNEYMVFKKITVTATSSGKNPIGNLLKIIGFKNIFSFKAEAYACVNEPSEFIRNTDFALDTAREFDNKYGNGNLQTISSKIQERMGKIFGTINKFLE